MYDIESLYEATSVADACRALAADPTAEVIAGGTDVLVKLREGKGAPAHLVSIHELHDELDGVTLAEDGTVEIGPITWFHHVTTSPVIQATVPTLGDACDTPGGPQLRVSGTWAMRAPESSFSSGRRSMEPRVAAERSPMSWTLAMM